MLVANQAIAARFAAKAASVDADLPAPAEMAIASSMMDESASAAALGVGWAHAVNTRFSLQTGTRTSRVYVNVSVVDLDCLDVLLQWGPSND